MYITRKILIGLVLLAILVIAGMSTPAPVVNAQSTENVQVRFVHALPGVGAVDIYLDNNLVVPNASFADATPHLALAAGNYTITLRTAGAPATAAGLYSQALSLVPTRVGLRQTLIVQAGAAGTPEISLNTDDLNPAQLGQARLHIIHAAAGLGPLDLIGKNGAPIAQGIAFNTPFGTVNPPVSEWDLAIVPNGGTPAEAIVDVGVVRFNTGMLYTLIVAGTASDAQVIDLATPLNADSTVATVLVRIAHGSSDAPPIDIYANDETKIIVDLLPGDVTPHVVFPVGEVALTVREAGSPPNSEPIATSRINLSSTTGAASVVAVGSLTDASFTFSIYEDNIANLTSTTARLRVINTALTGPATVRLTGGQPPAALDSLAIVENLATFNASDTVDMAPGTYSVQATVASTGGNLELELPAQTFAGGTYSTLLLYANADAGLKVSTTAINLALDSLPGSLTGVAVAAVDPNTTVGNGSSAVDSSTNTTTSSTDTSSPATTASADQNTTGATTSTVAQTTPVTPPPPVTTNTTSPAPVTNPPQQTDNKVRGIVNLNQGVNLQCREYPSPIAFSLGLIPNGTELEIRGYAGPADPEVIITFIPVEEGAFDDPKAAESFNQIWLSTYWTTPDGGTIECWVRADFVLITYRNRFIRQPADFFALEELDLPVPIIQAIPHNYPGEAVDTTITPPTPAAAAQPIATVNLDTGVNLHLRRQPDPNSESLALVPNGTSLVIIERTALPAELEATPTSEGTPTPTPLPTPAAWLFVEYTAPDGVVFRGWVHSQFVSLSLGGRRLNLEDIPVADFIQSGEVVGIVAPTTTATAPAATTGPVVGVVNIPQGSNLNMYDVPSVTGALVRSLGAGATVTVLGRNSEGTWLNVRYEVIGEGTWVGWVNNSGGWVILPVPVNTLPITG